MGITFHDRPGTKGRRDGSRAFWRFEDSGLIKAFYTTGLVADGTPGVFIQFLFFFYRRRNNICFLSDKLAY
jgi:hypothetical protein